MNRLEAQDPAQFAKARFGGLWALAAGLTTAQASATGVAINQLAVVAGKKFEGIKVDVPVELLADSGQSLTVGIKLKTSSASGGTFVEWGATGYTDTVIQNTTTATGAVTRGIASLSKSLVGAKKWVRVNVRRKGSAADTGSDISASAIAVNFFGCDREAP